LKRVAEADLVAQHLGLLGRSFHKVTRHLRRLAVTQQSSVYATPCRGSGARLHRSPDFTTAVAPAPPPSPPRSQSFAAAPPPALQLDFTAAAALTPPDHLPELPFGRASTAPSAVGRKHLLPRSSRGCRIGRDRSTSVETSISALDASTEGVAAYQFFLDEAKGFADSIVDEGQRPKASSL